MMRLEYYKMTDEWFLIVTGLAEGNPRPLRDYLARGGKLHDDVQKELVAYFDRELARKRRGVVRERQRPGPQRSAAQKLRERNIRRRVLELQEHFAWSEGSFGSKERALLAYSEAPGRDPSVGEESLRKYVGPGLSRDRLRTIDKMRNEANHEPERGQPRKGTPPLPDPGAAEYPLSIHDRDSTLGAIFPNACRTAAYQCRFDAAFLGHPRQWRAIKFSSASTAWHWSSQELLNSSGEEPR